MSVRVSMRVLWSAGAALVLLATLAGQVASDAAPVPRLTSTGSSFAAVAITQWQDQFNEVDGGNIDFAVSSSILGLDGFCNQTVDFGATDISYATNQAACTAEQVPYHYQYVPDVGGSLAFEYNLRTKSGKRITDLVLDDTTIAKIFTGAVADWDNPAIEALNPGLRLPHEQITPYYRSDPAGESYLLSDYLVHTDPTLLAAFQQVAGDPTAPGTASATWAAFPNGKPTSGGGFPNIAALVAANGGDAAAQGPVHREGGISYVETASADTVGFPVASVVNAAGDAAQPSAEDSADALQGVQFHKDLTENLTGVFDDTASDAYPLSAYSYFVTQCVPKQAAAQNFSCDGRGKVTMSDNKGAALGQFFTYVACLGQARMADLGYTPLPANLVEDDFQAVGRLPGGTTPPPPTATNCPNPTLSGG